MQASFGFINSTMPSLSTSMGNSSSAIRPLRVQTISAPIPREIRRSSQIPPRTSGARNSDTKAASLPGSDAPAFCCLEPFSGVHPFVSSFFTS